MAGLCGGPGYGGGFAQTGEQGSKFILGRFERELISGLLERNNFNLNKTAEQLKISRHALRYRMQRLNIHLAEDGEDRTAGKEAS